MQVIAVEEGLSNVKSALSVAGYQVTGVRPEEIGKADAVVVSGMDINFTNVQEIINKIPVVNADARSAEEIVSDLRERLS